MITYLLKSGILLFVFYAVYKLLLENEKMFRFNRAYLLGSLALSFVLPLNIFSFGSKFLFGTKLIQLNEVVIQKSSQNLQSISYNDFLVPILVSIYVLIVLFLIIRFLLNLYSFYKKIKESKTDLINGENVVLIDDAVLPHSFWNTIFINKSEFENGKIPNELIMHEKAHLVQKHSLDILFLEILQIAFWFNPLIILYKKAIKLNHEFLADEAVNKQFNSVSDYQNLLLDFASNKKTISLASNINYLITKKRLLMMTKKESPVNTVLKVVITTVICVFVLFIFSAKSLAQKVQGKPVSVEKESIEAADTIEKKPEFPGGLMAFYKFFGKHYQMPAAAVKEKIQGKLFMQFMVEEDGSLSEIKIIKNLGYGLGEEAERVLKLSPKWNPGTQDDKPVRVLYALPITITSQN
ncbi:beta-lactamase regulating signal transducer with metallopeptidase domain [Flavobacterium sp. HSC-32F16]|uniref:M56 family metallopeptidase n=1 Tax=Flavobacterium sp. HSC-32F16 TaxID=2910964 RepID=UPI0020A356CC|nr:M56 family metallopeptidase [Flavobacterium sp. HSC-32F16]MCP2026746.1 beta-lactamase regulating signal transducer with metallopeptidase domain [Flavobacterium sp. HSC-32F16]